MAKDIVDNPKPLVVSICDESGNMLRPWADAGCECIAVDIEHSIRRDREHDGIQYVWGDCRSWVPPRRPAIAFGFTPCTNLAGSGSRDTEKKGWPMLRDGMDLFWDTRRSFEWAFVPYLLENPVGRISTIYSKPDYTFDPCDFGGYLDPPVDPYTKKTCLWTGGGLVMPEKRPVEPVEGSKMHKMAPSADRQKLRSQTPTGSATAIYEANKHLLDR